ncbi:MAG: Crp/Fnr family transcriptional regulator [Gammaproteobacteria bacterium]|nr:Crp/Fnr family transcriptional regulator [Gammaproteobacteria bacterium]
MTPNSSTFSVTPEMLGHVHVLDGLDHDLLADIASRCRGRRFSKGQEIAAFGETEGDVFFLLEGKVTIALFSESGKEVVFRDLGLGAMFGELTAIDRSHRSADVDAAEDCAVAAMCATDFLEVVAQDRELMLRVLQQLSQLVRALSQRVFEHDALKVGSRIHAELYRMALENGQANNQTKIVDAPTDEQLANRIGTTREAVNKELSNMRRMGLVDKGPGWIEVRDVNTLQRLVTHEPVLFAANG